MKTKKTRFLAILIALTMVLSFTLSGCGREEVVEEDVVTTITVTSDELMPELTDEDLGITRKEVSELSKIVGYQSWENYYFIVLKSEGGEGDLITTVQIEDKDYFNALYNARHFVYFDVDYSSVAPDDEMYAAYAKGLRSLGESFYKLAEGDGYIEEVEETVPLEEETVAEEPTEETDETADSEDSEDSEEATEEETTEDTEEEVEEPEEVVEEDTEDLEDTVGEDGDIMSIDDLKNGGLKDNAETEATKRKLDELSKAINSYMASVSLYRANQILVYAKDGELLGLFTAEKLNDYVKAFDVAPLEYTPANGVIYTSDLESGKTYSVKGTIASEKNEFQYLVKNDLNIPVIVYATCESVSSEEYMFNTYMPTAKSQGWYLIEGQYDFVSTQDTYNFRIEYKNSDADMIAYLPETKVLAINDLEDKPIIQSSMYSAIVNNTDETVYLEADTGDTYTLGSKQAIGVHRAAYNTITYYFEGAKALVETLEESADE